MYCKLVIGTLSPEGEQSASCVAASDELLIDVSGAEKGSFCLAYFLRLPSAETQPN